MSQSASSLPISLPSSSPPPQPTSGVVQTPRGPLTPMQQLEALRRVQMQAEQKLKLGNQLFKAAQSTASQHHNAIEQLRREQAELREQMRADLEQSLGRFELRVNHAENGLTQTLDKVNERLEKLESEWGQMQVRMEAMAARADALLMQATDVLGQSAQMLAQVANQQTAPAAIPSPISNQVADVVSSEREDAASDAIPALVDEPQDDSVAAAVTQAASMMAAEDVGELPALIDEETSPSAETLAAQQVELDDEELWLEQQQEQARAAASQPVNVASAMSRIRFAAEEDVTELGTDDLRIRLVPEIETDAQGPEPVIDLSDLHLLLPPEERAGQLGGAANLSLNLLSRRYGWNHPALPELQPKLSVREDWSDLAMTEQAELEASGAMSFQAWPAAAADASAQPASTVPLVAGDAAGDVQDLNPFDEVSPIAEASDEIAEADDSAADDVKVSEPMVSMLCPTDSQLLGPVLDWPETMLLSDVLPMPPGEMIALTHPNDSMAVEREETSAPVPVVTQDRAAAGPIATTIVEREPEIASAPVVKESATSVRPEPVIAQATPVAPAPSSTTPTIASAPAPAAKRSHVIRAGAVEVKEANPQALPKAAPAEAQQAPVLPPRYVRSPAADGVVSDNDTDRDPIPSDFYRKIVARLRQQIDEEKKL